MDQTRKMKAQMDALFLSFGWREKGNKDYPLLRLKKNTNQVVSFGWKKINQIINI